jgi:hypothetical protein
MMIEFAVAYWDPTWPASVVRIEVHMMADRVRVVAGDVADMEPSEWDARRSRIAGSGHSDWAEVYKGTPIEAAAGRIEAQAFMAFGELHVLAPDSATAAAMVDDSGRIVSTYSKRVVRDSLGNPLRLLHYPLAPEENEVAMTLMTKAVLHRLEVASVPSRGDAFQFATYFAPFHMPGIATGELTDAEIALKRSLPT